MTADTPEVAHAVPDIPRPGNTPASLALHLIGRAA